MQVPILKHGQYLIAQLQAALTDEELLRFREELADSIGTRRIRGVILDVSALDVMDSFGTRTLRGIAQAARLRGAVPVVVGIQPEVAFAMVQLGLTLEGIQTGLDLEEGLEYLDGQRDGRKT